MSAVVPHTALTTFDEVQTSSMRSDLWLDEAHNQPDVLRSVVKTIVAKSDKVEQRLNRNLVVRRYEHRLDWELVPGGGYVAKTPNWPVVQVDTSGVTINDDGDLESSSLPGTVVYYAGYRRDDQGLEDLQAHCAGLAVLPPVLPGDITDGVNDMVVIHLRRRASGTLGVASRSQTIGGDTVSYQREQTNSEEQILRSLQTYRRIPI